MTPNPSFARVAALWACAGATALLAACGGGSSGNNAPQAAPGTSPPPAPAAPAPAATTPATANTGRDVLATSLTVDAAERRATADITFAPSTSAGATLEVGDLRIDGVVSSPDGGPVAWTVRGDRLDLGLPASAQNSAVKVRYRFQAHEAFDGASASGYTYTWPYFCGNLFPCHSEPSDGVDFTLQVDNPPPGQRVVQAAAPMHQAPSYQVAWAVGDYGDLQLGQTRAGTRLVASYLPGEQPRLQQGTAHLLAAFEWLETNLGPYRFGPQAGPVSVPWRAGATGGIEHHPRWHIAGANLENVELQVHESVHGWLGNGVRIACWEDFVLSEGSASYLTGRILDVVAPDVGAEVWARYAQRLRGVRGDQPAWPEGCGQVDVVKGGLFSDAAYMRGAFFYRALALKLGAPAVDRAFARLYRQQAGQAARMQDMLDAIQAETGFDPRPCANLWLRAGTVPQPGACV